MNILCKRELLSSSYCVVPTTIRRSLHIDILTVTAAECACSIRVVRSDHAGPSHHRTCSLDRYSKRQIGTIPRRGYGTIKHANARNYQEVVRPLGAMITYSRARAKRRSTLRMNAPINTTFATLGSVTVSS